MNTAVIVLFTSLAIVLGIAGYATLRHESTASCEQRNSARITVRHIIHRQEVGYAKIKDLKDENTLRKEIAADYSRVQPIDC